MAIAHASPGAITVPCREGVVDFSVANKARTLRAGDMLLLTPGEPHARDALEDASLLVTLHLPHGTP